MFQKFNFDTEWAVKLISKITNDEDIPIEGDAIVKQVRIDLIYLKARNLIYFRALKVGSIFSILVISMTLYL